MTQITLLLGPIAFQDFEVASGVSFGGTQRLAIHDLPSGGRIIDALGDGQGQITIAGILSGPDATLRARALATLRGEGGVLPLTWDVLYYSVIIQSFQADYRSPWWIPFRLTCAVLRDEAAALISDVLSLAAGILADLGAAISAAPAGVDFSSAQTALAQPDATVLGTAAYGGALNSLAASSATLSSGLTAAEAGLDTSSVFSAGAASDGIAALSAAVSSSQQLSNVSTAQAYVGRATANLINAST